MPLTPQRPRSTLITVFLLWLAFYASFTLFTPALLDDADSVHAEVAREMLLRHDYVTLYANGIRYLEKAPLLYWSMAACMKAFMLFGATTPRMLAAAARLPLAFTMLALAMVCEAFARRLFHSARAGLYAALILLSSFGMFIFTRITIPDAVVCLWLTVALYAFWRTEDEPQTLEPITNRVGHPISWWTIVFAGVCALNVLTKGLIGLVFPLGIVLVYMLITRGLRGTLTRLGQLQLLKATLVFLVIAAPWHILAGLANPTQGHPTPFHFLGGHWQVPMPTDGNVRGWYWFYFMNEHVLRYLNLRVPRDYDTSPLWLFWGLCLAWLIPWSNFLIQAVADPVSQWVAALRIRLTAHSNLLALHTPQPDRAGTLLLLWAALPLAFFSLSTRQEYYVMPALPAMSLLIAAWLAQDAERTDGSSKRHGKLLAILGSLIAVGIVVFLLHTSSPSPGTDLSQLLQQNPGDYALSMGHFMDLNAQALGLFRLPLVLTAISVCVGPVAAWLLLRQQRRHAANLALAAATFVLLFASHLALSTFAPVLSSAQLAEAIAPQVQPQDLIVIHGEYEAGSTLGFYLQRPLDYSTDVPLNPNPGIGPHLGAISPIHILEGRSSNLWYGSFFPDAPPIFETAQSIAEKWAGPQRIFMWQSTTDEPRNLPALPGKVYVIAQSGGKEIVSNQPDR